jgi:hypothetical protein
MDESCDESRVQKRESGFSKVASKEEHAREEGEKEIERRFLTVGVTLLRVAIKRKR